MKIRLIETNEEQPILLSSLKAAEELVEVFEVNLLEILENQSSRHPTSLSNKVRLAAELAAKYQETGFRNAAIATLKRMEPLYFELLETSDESIDDEMRALLVTGYLTCGCVEDALCAAEATSKILARRLMRNKEKTADLASWINNQFRAEIEAFEQRHEAKAVRMRHERIYTNVGWFESNVIDLAKKDDTPMGA